MILSRETGLKEERRRYEIEVKQENKKMIWREKEHLGVNREGITCNRDAIQFPLKYIEMVHRKWGEGRRKEKEFKLRWGRRNEYVSRVDTHTKTDP